MKLFETLQMIERVDQLIRLKATGTPTQLAQRLQLSERSIYNVIEIMKEMGAPIYYNRSRRSYCYEENVKFKFGFYFKEGESERLYGGFGKVSEVFSVFSGGLQKFCSKAG